VVYVKNINTSLHPIFIFCSATLILTSRRRGKSIPFSKYVFDDGAILQVNCPQTHDPLPQPPESWNYKYVLPCLVASKVLNVSVQNSCI
jgi:hypothetical protein